MVPRHIPLAQILSLLGGRKALRRHFNKIISKQRAKTKPSPKVGRTIFMRNARIKNPSSSQSRRPKIRGKGGGIIWGPVLAL